MVAAHARSMTIMPPKFRLNGILGSRIFARSHPLKTLSSNYSHRHGKECVDFISSLGTLLISMVQPHVENLTGTRGSYRPYNTVVRALMLVHK